MATGRILPAGGSFHAVVDGTPTALAGCNVTQCERADCIRKDSSLTYRARMSVPSVSECRAYIRLTA